MKYVIASLALCATPALADLEVRFIEGAPKDTFLMTFNSACPVTAMQVTVDLKGSQGALIFDTTEQGAGVEVFQPFELVQGAAVVTSAPRVSDGDRAVTLDIGPVTSGQKVAFTIDVDDTVSNRQITVTGSEISGASVVAAGQSGVFGSDATARVALPDCMG